MPVFPNERPIPQEDLIALAEADTFQDFYDAVDNGSPAAHSTSRKDYVFTQAGNSGHILVARPLNAVGTPLMPWAKDVNDPNGPEWLENASYDPATGGLDQSTCPNPPPQAIPAGVPGTCGTCGNAPALVGGGVPAFCPSCGSAMPQPVPVPAPAPVGLPGVFGGAAAGHNPNRMEGRPKKEAVVPPGMTACTKSKGFENMLDSLLDATDAPPDGTGLSDYAHAEPEKSEP